MRSSVYRVFPSGLTDRTNANGLVTAGAARSVARGNEIEGSLSLSNLGLGATSAPPFLLVLGQDSLGREDVGDIVFSSRPGVLSVVPFPSSAPTLPTATEVSLAAFSVRAYHQNVTLQALTLAVDGTAGGGVQFAFAQIGSRNETINSSALGGSQVTVNFTSGGPLTFNPNGAEQQLTIFGHAIGPIGVGAVRVLLAGSQDVRTGAAPAGSSGHGSALPPLVFERAYVGAAPSAIRIDGAFADWESVRPFDQDPDNDVATTVGAPSPGGPNPPSRINQNIDIRQTRMDSNSGASQVSFYLQVDGSIMAGTLLDFPSLPTQTQLGGSGSGGSGPGGPLPDSDIATIYLDADNNFATGWQALPNLGVDKVVQIVGKGGGYGRTAQVTLTSVWSWDPFALRFNKTDRPLPVGLGSSKLETQVNASDLCSGACGRMRYAFFLQDVAQSVDRTVSLDGNVRGQSEALLFTESAARTSNAYPGEIHVPVLAFALFSPSTNEHTALLVTLDARIEGVHPDDVVAVNIFPDEETAGVLDSVDLAAGPLAHGQLSPDGVARLTPTLGLTLSPGGAISGLLTVDIASNASTPAWLNSSVGREAGLHTSGVAYVSYSWPDVPPSVRLLADLPGTRAQNNLVINEVNVVSGWIEVFDKTGAATSLTSPSTMGLVIYNTNNAGGNLATNAIIVFTGSTNSKGFAAFNYSTPYSTATRKYFVALWCGNCTAGQDARGRNNNTYLDFVQMPLSTSQGAWGRYPDGNVSLFNTTNNTRADNNQLAAGSGAGNPQNNLVVNEVNFVSGWIEVYLTLAFAVSLTSPSTMGLVIYHTNGQGNNYVADALIVFTGSTNAEGFAVFNYSAPYSTSNRRYHVAIWCNNCSAGRDSLGNDNGTAVNDVEMPLSAAQGAWGRYPDGNGTFVNTTNNTRADNNAIPEFSDVAYPLVGIIALAPIVHRRAARARHTP